jgi:hypothetical protein
MEGVSLVSKAQLRPGTEDKLEAKCPGKTMQPTAYLDWANAEFREAQGPTRRGGMGGGLLSICKAATRVDSVGQAAIN